MRRPTRDGVSGSTCVALTAPSPVAERHRVDPLVRQRPGRIDDEAVHASEAHCGVRGAGMSGELVTERVDPLHA